jgi:hypothetical protein
MPHDNPGFPGALKFIMVALDFSAGFNCRMILLNGIAE